MNRPLLLLVISLFFLSCSSEDSLSKFLIEIESNGNGYFEFCAVEGCSSLQSISEMYDAGTIVEFEAIPDTYYAFDRWSDGSDDPKRRLTLNRDYQLTVSFVKQNLVGKSKAFSGGSGGNEGAGRIIESNDGYFFSGFTTSNGGGDFPDHENPQNFAKMFLVKVNSDDRIEWIKVYEEEFFPRAGILTSDGLISLGESNSETGTIFRSFDFDGNMKISKNLGVTIDTNYSRFHSINYDGKDLFIIYFNNGISEIDGDGNMSEFMGLEEYEFVTALNKMPNGNLIVAGRKNIQNQRFISVSEIDPKDKSILREVAIDYGNSPEMWVGHVVSASEDSFILGGSTDSRSGIFENDLSFKYNYPFILKYSFDENLGWVQLDNTTTSRNGFQISGEELVYLSSSNELKEAHFNKIDIETGELYTKTYRSGQYLISIRDIIKYQNGFIISGSTCGNEDDFSIFDGGCNYSFLLRIDDNGNILD